MEKPTFDLTKDQKQARQQSELSALKQDQIAIALGEKEGEFVEGNRKPGTQIRALEAKGYVHVWTRVKHLDQGGKSFTNEDRTIKIHAREFDNRVKDGAFKTYDEVEVIHDPRKNAPKEYALKPEILGAAGDVQDKVNAATGKAQEKLDKEKAHVLKTSQILEKKIGEVNTKVDELNIKEGELTTKEQQLADREAELAKREAALNVAPTINVENNVSTRPEAPKK